MAKQKLKLIWTWGHRPFVMGGSVNYVLATKVPCSGPHDMGRGYKGFVATAPNGKTFVSESRTGAIVGQSLKQVKADIASGDTKVMKTQVAKAAEDVKRAEFHEPDFFWRALRCAYPAPPPLSPGKGTR